MSDSQNRGLIFHGEPGKGKTYIAWLTLPLVDKMSLLANWAECPEHGKFRQAEPCRSCKLVLEEQSEFSEAALPHHAVVCPIHQIEFLTINGCEKCHEM